MIDRVGKPTSTLKVSFSFEARKENLQKTNDNVWTRIDETNEPRIPFTVALSLTEGTAVCDSHVSRER